MNKKIIVLYILVILLIFTMISMSFAGAETANTYKINEKTISLRIEGINENIFNNNEFKVEYTDDSLTVLDAIEEAIGKENITTITSYHGGKYISKINNDNECILDNGEYAGWQYRVNGLEPYDTIDKYILADYDKIVLYYGSLNTEEPYEKENISKKLLSDEYLISNKKKKFKDIENKRVDLLVSMGVITGEIDDNFYPDNNITRAEVITLLAKLSREEIKTGNNIVFSDTPEYEWYIDMISWGYNKGIVNGYQNRFEPDEYVTREDLAVMFVKYLKRVEGEQFEDLEPNFSDTVDMYEYSKSAIANLAKLKIITGKPNNRFEPKGFATRYETVIILTNFLDLKYDDVNL